MQIIDAAISIKRSNEIPVPLYHRGHLSLRTDTQVTLCVSPVHNQLLRSCGLSYELIVSPIKFDSWGHLVRISALLYERPGVVSKVLHAVARERLDVLYEESAPIASGEFHKLEIVADARNNDHAVNDAVGALREIELRLQAMCCRDLVLTNTVPRLTVAPLRGLRNVWTQHKKSEEGLPLGRAPMKRRRSVASSTQPARALQSRTRRNAPNSTHRHFIALPPEFRNFFESRGIDALAFMSDTDERLLRAYLIPRDVAMTFVRVIHSDQRGALAHIADQLCEYFNVFMSLNRLERQGENNICELMLFSPQYKSRSLADQRSRRHLISSALAHKSFEGLEIRLEYPRSLSSGRRHMTWEPHTYRGVSKAARIANRASTDKDMLARSTRDIVQAQLDALKSLQAHGHDAATGERHRELNDALRAINERLLIPASLPKQVFLSYSFTDELATNWAEQIRVELEKREFEVITGKRPTERGTITQSLVERIRNAQVVLGLWTVDRGSAVSPWLHWEMGVAHGYGLPVVLMAHERVGEDQYRRVQAERHTFRFNMQNFSTEMRFAISFLVNEAQWRASKHFRRRSTDN